MRLFHNPFAKLDKTQWIIYLGSLIVVTVSAFLGGSADPLSLIASLIGVSALIFLAGGDVWGQILTCVFAILYAIVSLRLSYYSEAITYLGLSAPIALFSVLAWLRHPDDVEPNVVKIHRLRPREVCYMLIGAVLTTGAGYLLLAALKTPLLAVSVLSVTTSFLASFLMFYRSPYYALAYAANDIVLLVLWVIAALQEVRYFAVVACFVAFFINDSFAFVRWRANAQKQAEKHGDTF